MDRVVEDIALVSEGTQNQDNEPSNKRKIRCKSHYIQDQNPKRLFDSKNYLNRFVLWIISFICLLLIAGPLALHVSYAVPAVKTRNIASHLFSEERARDYFVNLTLHGSRVSNTRGDFHARKFLISQIGRICSMSKRNLRCELDLQNFTDSSQNQLQNILVRLSNPATRSRNVSSLMLSAHYDTVEFSPGGSDDGSGVVILLELLSNLINDVALTFSDVHLIVLFTSGEKMGLLGAKAFITNHIWRSDIRRFINVDSISCNEKASLLQMTPSQVFFTLYIYHVVFVFSQLVIDYSRVARPRANVIIEHLHGLIGSSDYDTFSLNGSLLGYDFGFLLDGYIYHTSLDHPSMIKQGVLQDLGENLGTLARHILLGHVDLRGRRNSSDTDRFIYFDILGRYLIVYKMYTSIIIQKMLIILIIIVSMILIFIDHIRHRQRTLVCLDPRCIYLHFKYPFVMRIISILIYFIANVFSILVGLLLSMPVAIIMSIIRPLSWFGNSTLTIFLFSLPCVIGIIAVGYLWNIFHRFILRKSPKNLFRFDATIDEKHVNEPSFDFEQNSAVLFVYSLLMIASIYSDNRSFYIILVWSIIICPIYLLLMTVEFTLRWKQISWKVFEQGHHWLFLPLIISLIPLTHTIEIVDQLVRILIPLVARKFSFGWSLLGNAIICSLIAIPTTFFVLVFIPILQRTKYFGRALIAVSITFVIVFIVAYNRQPITSSHPNTFYAKHKSQSLFQVKTLSSIPYTVPLISQLSSITVITFDGLALSPVLDDFSAKSGHMLQNQQCFKPTNCTFDDTFNRTLAVQRIEIESMKNFIDYTIVVRHVLSYNIRVSSFPFVKFVVRNRLNIPRTETIIDVTLYSPLSSFNIEVKIMRCDLNDSPFLLLFTRLMRNIVLMGEDKCHAVDDESILNFDLNKLPK